MKAQPDEYLYFIVLCYFVELHTHNGVFGREEINNIEEEFCTFFVRPTPFTLYFNLNIYLLFSSSKPNTF